MKSMTKYPPLVRMTYMSMATATPRRRKRSFWPLVPQFIALLGLVMVLFGIWLAVG